MLPVVTVVFVIVVVLVMRTGTEVQASTVKVFVDDEAMLTGEVLPYTEVPRRKVI